MRQPPFAKAWAAQWKAADTALERVHAQALATLTEADALSASETLLQLVSLVTLPKSRRESSGFVEQQRLFARAR
jgi:hypothetical protein